ncbi:MAG: DUF1735 domain-containing protein [Bacteroidales bacterium]|nr:DUF1735 domain-containing protein [Bacteroidales bacterium]
MKNTLTAIIAAIPLLASCYPDYIGDYDVKGVCFANEVDVRSVVVGEGMKFHTAVVVGGMISNDEDRNVEFCTDMTLLSGETLSKMKTNALTYMQEQTRDITSLKLLPASQYSIYTDGNVSSFAVIRKGEHMGRIYVKIDSAAFLSSSDKLKPEYALPLRITDTGTLTPIAGKQTTVIGIHYECMLFGSWWHGGVCTDDSGNVLSSYPMTIPQSDTQVWTLTTVSPYSVSANAVAGRLNGAAAQMILTLGSDGTVSIASAEGASVVVEPDGESRFSGGRLQDRKIFLSYKFTDGGVTYHAKDTLAFRNRIRDGVNEWQDEISSR